MLVRMNALLSCPWADLPTGRYYWTHSAYFNTDDHENQAQMLLAWNGRINIMYTSQVLRYGTRIIDPTDGSVVHTQTFTTPQPADRDPFDQYSLLIAARWKFKAADGSEGYHLHRYPMNLEWVDGNQLTDEGHFRNLASAGTMYNHEDTYSSTGSLIVSWSVNRTIAEWQLRHGTKRRNSRFWLP
jgi:hypothetical protein